MQYYKDSSSISGKRVVFFVLFCQIRLKLWFVILKKIKMISYSSWQSSAPGLFCQHDIRVDKKALRFAGASYYYLALCWQASELRPPATEGWGCCQKQCKGFLAELLSVLQWRARLATHAALTLRWTIGLTIKIELEKWKKTTTHKTLFRVEHEESDLKTPQHSQVYSLRSLSLWKCFLFILGCCLQDACRGLIHSTATLLGTSC